MLTRAALETFHAIAGFLPGWLDPANLSEWLNLLLRWFHVFAAILWIGSTYYFTWLDHRLTEAIASAGPEGKGQVWMVHSGGFYTVEKQRPQALPAKLHWFRFEALFTWISGFLLLVVVYYWGGVLLDNDVSRLGMGQGIAVSLGTLALGWLVYDLLWISPLAQYEIPLVVLSYVLLVAAAWGLSRLLSARASFLHAGALMGTLMTANVWVRILPAQRRMVAGLREGKKPDEVLAARAKHRSKHNTFMVIPVVLTMISSHFPVTTYGARHAWATFATLTLVGWGAAKLLRDH